VRTRRICPSFESFDELTAVLIFHKSLTKITVGELLISDGRGKRRASGPLRLVRFKIYIFVLDLRVDYFVLNQPGARGLAAQRFGCGKLTALFPLEIRPSPVETSDKDEQDRRTEHK
jgi:hypothetical protein